MAATLEVYQYLILDWNIYNISPSDLLFV